MDTCPACGSTRVYASRHRSILERVRQAFTDKRPYRCHACHWRAWATVDVRVRPPADLDPRSLARPSDRPPIRPDDLDGLDLPGAERIGVPTSDGRPLETAQLDPLDPRES